MRRMLWRFITPTWKDVAPEVVVPSVRGICTLRDTLGQSGRAIYHDLLIRLCLYVAWTGGPAVEFQLLHTEVACSISSGGDHDVHCWWDLIRSKQLFSAPNVAYVFMYLSTPQHEYDVTKDQFFKQSLTGLNSEFSFSKIGCLTKAKELSLLYYLSITIGWFRLVSLFNGISTFVGYLISKPFS